MPKQKDLKRLVRSRMKKTGESYTTARVHITRSKRPTPSPASAALETLAGIKDKTILAKSGKSWAEWVRILDGIDGVDLPHRDIASHVHEEHGVNDWWSQSVTVGYERIRGLREIGQRRDGAYEASKSKTLPVTASVAFDAFVNARVRKRWLGDVALRVRKATPHKSIRITWPDGTDIVVGFTPKGAKCSLAIQHSKLASKEDANARKVFWAEKLGALEDLLRR